MYSSILYAAATSSLWYQSLLTHANRANTATETPPAWQLSLLDKLHMQYVRTIKTGGMPQAIIGHMPTKTIIVASPVPGQTTERHLGKIETTYRIETFDDGFLADIRDICIDYYLAALALDDHQNPIIMQVLPDRVSLHGMSTYDAIRIKHPDCRLGSATMTPTAHVVAVHAYNLKSDKRSIGLCTTADQTIETIILDAVHGDRIIPELAVSPDGLSIAWGTVRGELKILHTAKSKAEQTLATMENTEYHHLTWSPDKKILACGLFRHPFKDSLAIISATTGKILHERIMEAAVTACTFLGKKTLAVGTNNNEINMYRLHLKSNISPAVLSRLSPAGRALCEKIVESKERPYRLKTTDEKYTYKLLPKELRHSWLFKHVRTKKRRST